MKLTRIVVSEIITALTEVFVHSQHADKVIERTFKAHRKWGSNDRRIFAESVYDIVRWWRWQWHLAGLPEAEYLDKEKITPERLWRVWGVYWLEREGEWAPFAEARSVSQDTLRMRSEQDVAPALRASFPDWLYELGASETGREWRGIVKELNELAPVDLRVNTLRVSLRDLQELLHRREIEAGPVRGVPEALRLRERKNLFATAEFREGLFELQDASSQKIAPFLDLKPGMRVIDACAGAGGKTLHIATLMQNKGRIIALDIHEWKLEELRRRARRNGVGIVETRIIEGAKTIKRLSVSADRVLLDVPCSGLGVLRRNPDAKWKLSTEELGRLLIVQRDILQSHSRMVKPGGKLVYATCSILPAENEQQVQAFLSAAPDEWKLEEELQLPPGKNGGDGFYAARLVRLERVPVIKGATPAEQQED